MILSKKIVGFFVGFVIPNLTVTVPLKMGVINMELFQTVFVAFMVGMAGMTGKKLIDSVFDYFKKRRSAKRLAKATKRREVAQ